MTTILKGMALRRALVANPTLMEEHNCDFASVYLGEAECIVTFCFTEGEDAVYDLNSPMCSPGCPSDVEIGSVLINGEMVPAEMISEVIADKWRNQLVEACEQQAREDFEVAMIEREESRRDR